MPLAAFLWDLDGTLVDTAALHLAAWQAMEPHLGRPFTHDDFRTTFGWRNPEIFHYLAPGRWTAEQMPMLGELKESAYRAAVRQQGVVLLPGVQALLTAAASAGLRQAIASSAPRANLELILEITGAAHFFAALVGMEDTQRGKPDPQVFLLAAERLGVPASRCLVFEDAVAGVQAAKAGGMRCVAIARPGHHPPERLQAAGADLVVASLEKLDFETLRGLD
jgi:beta-phosphoglucomutase